MTPEIEAAIRSSHAHHYQHKENCTYVTVCETCNCLAALDQVRRDLRDLRKAARDFFKMKDQVDGGSFGETEDALRALLDEKEEVEESRETKRECARNSIPNKDLLLWAKDGEIESLRARIKEEQLKEAKTEIGILQLLTFEEVMKILRLSRTTVWRLVRGGHLPCLKFCGRPRFEPEAVQKFIEESRTSIGEQFESE